MNYLSPALARLADDLRHDGHECHSSRADRCANEASALEAALTEACADNALLRADAVALRADNTRLRNRVTELTVAGLAALWVAESARRDLAASRIMVASERARADAGDRTWEAMAADAATDAESMEAAGKWDLAVCQVTTLPPSDPHDRPAWDAYWRSRGYKL